MKIKVRVWNGEQMVSPDYVDRNGVAHWKENSIPCSSKDTMLFTGLTDKAGREIYPDDLLKGHDGMVFRVYSIQGGFAIKAPFWAHDLRDLRVGDELIMLPIAEPQTASYIIQSCEIVGNVHQNPELL